MAIGRTTAALLLGTWLALGFLLGPSPGRTETAAPFPPGEIVRAIEAGLFADDGVEAGQVEVTISDGIVTLTGTVDNLLARKRATERAQMVKGVRGVVNQVRVDPEPVPDDLLANSIVSALQDDPATSANDIEIEATDGRVTLRGQVDSRAEKELASTVAGSVRGVRELRNRLQVQPPVTRSEEEIRADILQRLRWDVYVDDGLISVTVNGDEAILEGTVGSATEKRRAISDAYVEGVVSVDADKLAVAYWARNERLRKDKYAYMTEAAIAQAIRDALRHDPRVDAEDITVVVEHRNAALSGTVESLRARRSAGETASNVVGVWSVENSLEVRPAYMPSDSTLRSKVQHRFFFDAQVSGEKITVTADKGKIRLYGSVSSAPLRERAEELAASVEGVAEVSNYLLVTPPEFQVQKSDYQILKSIQSELYWSPFVDYEEVEVDVKDGTAILTGVVDTMQERRAAEDNAFEGGALAVNNRLEIARGETR